MASLGLTLLFQRIFQPGSMPRTSDQWEVCQISKLIDCEHSPHDVAPRLQVTLCHVPGWAYPADDAIVSRFPLPGLVCGAGLDANKRTVFSLSQPLGAAYSPLIACNLLPLDFMTCDELLDLRGNITAKQELGYGCVNFGGQKYHEVEFTSVKCEALPLIECHGNRTFMREGIPCIKYTTHYFLTTLLYSILLGLAGIDRFCLGHVGAAVGKLLTLGGAGLWWIIDIVLLVSGQLTPEDGSNWIPYV